MAKVRLLFVALTLIAVFATTLLVVHPAHAQARTTQIATTQNVATYSGSRGFVNWWGYGARISHSDLQGINSYDYAYGLASTLLQNRYGGGVGILAQALWAYYRWLLAYVDRGNGVYIAWPWVGGGPYIWGA